MPQTKYTMENFHYCNEKGICASCNGSGTCKILDFPIESVLYVEVRANALTAKAQGRKEKFFKTQGVAQSIFAFSPHEPIFFNYI